MRFRQRSRFARSTSRISRDRAPCFHRAFRLRSSPFAVRAKPAISDEVSTDLPPPGRAPSASACEPYRERILEALGRGRNAMVIWLDLIDDHGFAAVRECPSVRPRRCAARVCRAVLSLASVGRGCPDLLIRRPDGSLALVGRRRRGRLDAAA
jgi:hypothetical protein